MFKVSEVAGKLNVDTYVIFEKLMNHGDLLKNHTEKIHSINYIDDKGIEIIEALVAGKSEAEIVEILSKTSTDLTQPGVIDTQDAQDELAMDELDAADIDTYYEDWLNEDDFEALDIEKRRLREDVGNLRGQLIQYDSELRRLDDAILNYQKLMREDGEYLLELESKLNALEKSVATETETGGMFSFIRK